MRDNKKGKGNKKQTVSVSLSHSRNGIYPSHIPAPDSVIDLDVWHHAIHQVTGDMALHFNRATTDDLKRWSRMLRRVAQEMDTERERRG